MTESMKEPTPYEQIGYAVDGPIATITLDRPGARNAWTIQMAFEILDALDRADADQAVRVVVVTGRGADFCVGADLSTPTLTSRVGVERRGTIGGQMRDTAGMVTLRILALDKPIIAAINGPSVGVGATFILPMDVRLAADTARFGYVFARRGLVPEGCSTWFLPRIVGIGRALDWVVTGRVFPAAEAVTAGLVQRTVPAGELMAATYETAGEIAERVSPIGAAVARRLIWRMQAAASPWDAHRLESHAIESLRDAGEVTEGVLSFLQKRPPAFPSADPGFTFPEISPPWPEPPDDLG